MKPGQKGTKKSKEKGEFRTYAGYNNEISPFTVFIIHGGKSKEHKKIQKFIKEKLHFDAITLEEKKSGDTIIRKLQKTAWEQCDCTVAILTGEDTLITSKIYARPNVLFEIGYLYGYFDQLYVNDLNDDIHPVIWVHEDITDIPSDLQGIERYIFSKKPGSANPLRTTFPDIKVRLETLFSQIKEYWQKENE